MQGVLYASASSVALVNTSTGAIGRNLYCRGPAESTADLTVHQRYDFAGTR